MISHIILQQKERLFLLIEYTDRFHIITVNDQLEWEKEEKILSEVCSEAVMDEMGLKRKTLPKAQLRGVALAGRLAGDTLILHAKEGKFKYVLSDDYDEAYLDAMFKGIPRLQAPKSRYKGDWRQEKQDPGEQKIMSILGGILSAAGLVCGCSIFFLKRMSVGWFVVYLVTLGASLSLYFTHPQYFSLMDPKEYSRRRFNASVEHLAPAVSMPGFALMYHGLMDYHFFDGFPWIPVTLVGLGVAAIAFALSRELREDTTLSVFTVLFSVFLALALVAHINHLANFNASNTQPHTVIDTYRNSSSRRSDRYKCKILLESGQELTIRITRAMFETLEPGDTVEVYEGTGALGIPYVFVPE